jgi:hypothetical protein
MPFTHEQAQELHENIKKLVKSIETAGNRGRDRLADISWEKVRDSALTLDSNKEFNSAAWDELSSKEQDARADRLHQLKISLLAVAGQDGPEDTSHIMHYARASNTVIISMLIFMAVVNISLLSVVIWKWDAATGLDRPLAVENAIKKLKPFDDAVTNLDKARLSLLDSENAQKKIKQQKKPDKAKLEKAEASVTEAQNAVASAEILAKAAKDSLNNNAIVAIKAIRDGSVTESTILFMVVMLGALGGSLHMTGSFGKFVGNRQLLRSWVPYYFLIPFVGAILASIVYMVVRIGFVTPTGTARDGASLTDLNLIGIYSFAALSGMFAKTATDKLADVFNTIFRANGKERDPLKSSENSGPDGE